MKQALKRSVSIIIPCLNEERNVARCLDAIARQTYPHDRIEVLVADGMSSDRTRALITAWRSRHDVQVEIVDNPRVVAEFGNAEALKRAQGEFVYLMGMDEEMAQADMVEAMVDAFDVFPDIVGVEQEFLPIPGGNLVNNYLAVIHINDPLARDIAPAPRAIAKIEKGGRVYREYKFSPGFPAKLLFRRDCLEQFVGQETFEEGQVMLKLALEGANRMARIDGYGVYHHNVTSLRQYLRKRAKIALKHTTRTRQRTTWVDYTGKRMYLFAFLHLTVVYPLLCSLWQALRSRQPLWLLHAPMAFVCTGTYAVSYLRIRLTGKRAW